MALSNTSTSVPCRQGPQTIADKLAAILAALPADDLLTALQAPTGRRGYGGRVLLNAYIACFFLNTASISEALRRIEDDSRLAEVVGGAPTKFAMSRFVKKLTGHVSLLEQCMSKVTTLMKGFLPDLGNEVAADSTDLKAWSRKVDADATWSAKTGNDGRKRFWFGYKAHIICDVTHEIPLEVHVTTANVADTTQLLSSMERLTKNGFRPSHVIADPGYDSAENYRLLADDFHAVPIIKLNRRGKKTDQFRSPHRTAAYVAASMRGLAIRSQERDTQEWQERYSKRGAIERVNSRLKEFRRLNKLTMLGKAKAVTHCLVSVLTLLLSSLAALLVGRAQDIRLSAT